MGIKKQDPLNLNEWVNLTDGVEYLPIRRTLFSDLGLFVEEPLDSNTAILPITTVSDYVMVDIPYGTRVKNTQANSKATLRLAVPHFGEEDAVRPLDVKGKIAWEDFQLGARPETLNNVIERKQIQHRQTMVRTHELAMKQLIVDGTAYAPNGTIICNYFTAFGVAQSTIALNLTPDVDPTISIQAIKDNITDNFKGGFTPSQFTAIIGRTAFDKLKSHPFVIENSRQILDRQSLEILTGTLGTDAPVGANLGKMYQVLDFGGVLWIRVDTDVLPVDDYRLFPTDVPDMFKMFTAPSDMTFDSIDQPAQLEYYWEKMEADRTGLSMVYETNFLCGTLWPKAIVKGTATYA